MFGIRRKRTLLFVAIGLFVGWVLYNTLQIHLYSISYYNTKSDVAVVLGAGSSDGKLSPVFRERVNHAIKLFQEERIDHIIFTGGYGEGQKISDSQSAKGYAISKGIPAESIFIEEKSTVTYENLAHAKQIMDKMNWNSALIVSDPYHMKRAMAMVFAHEINGKPSPTQTTMYRSWKTKLSSLIYESFYYNIDLIIGRV